MHTAEHRYYHSCIANHRPYFGRLMRATQGSPIRHAYMQALVELECRSIGGRPFQILEIGSWAGGSAITWASALKKFNGGRGLVVCVDPWEPYFCPGSYSDVPDTSIYLEMADALLSGEIHKLFLHNILSSGHGDIIVPFKGYSSEIIPLFADEQFDLIFIDGAHDYENMKKDLFNCSRLVRDGGVICGDDLELQISQLDLDHATRHKNTDYILDPRAATWHHPGVSLAVGEFFGETSTWKGFWAMRRQNVSWNSVEDLDCRSGPMQTPGHLIEYSPPELVGTSYKGFNIVHFGHTFYALALRLGHVDLTQIHESALSGYHDSRDCFIGSSVEDVKRLIDTMAPATHSPFGRNFSADICPAPDPGRTDTKKGNEVTFSRELCLRYDGSADDRRFVVALLDCLFEGGCHVAFYGLNWLCTYIINLTPGIKDKLACIVDDNKASAARDLNGIPITASDAIPSRVDVVFICDTRWRSIHKIIRNLPENLRSLTLDVVAEKKPEVIPERAWIPRIESIYPLEIPEVEFKANQDLILLDLPARTIAQMPAGFGHIHNAMKKTGLRFQTVDLDNVIYHRFHSHRILDGIPHVVAPDGSGIPEDPWQSVHYLEWEKPYLIEYFRQDIDEFVAGLIRSNPKIIGISLQQANISFAREIVRGVKRALAGVVVVVGGMSCLQPNAAKFVFPEAEYTVVGEGDLTVGPLIEALARGERPFDMPGIWSQYDTPDREFSPGPIVHDLNTLDFPHYEWTNIQLYRNWNDYQLTPIIGSRGCPWARCRFCGERFQWRTRTPELIVDELEWYFKQGFDHFVFNESDLHGDPRLTELMCDEIIRRGLKIRMTAQLRCHPKVDRNYYAKLKQAGFVCLRFGVDGGSTNTLRLERKGYTKDMIRNNLRACTEAGLFNEVNLVIGIPGETEQDVDETINFLKDLKHFIGRVAFINPLMIFRGSDYWEKPEEFGIVFRSHKELLYSTYPVAIPDDEWYSINPYIDRKVRYLRLGRVVAELKRAGLPLGDFAKFTVDQLTHRDLANTHNITGKFLDHNSLRKSDGTCRIFSSSDRTMGQSQKSDAGSNESAAHTIHGNILFVCTTDSERTVDILSTIHCDRITLLVSQHDTRHWPDYPRIETSDNISDLTNKLRELNFDLTVVPYKSRLGNISIERFVSTFCQRLLAIYPDGQMQMYEGEQFDRIIYNMSYLRNMYRYIADLKGKHVLEVGCSDGLTCDLVSKLKPESLTGIDTVENVGIGFKAPNTEYFQMDAARLRFPDASFDLCYSIATLEHCIEPHNVLEEMKRVTKPGGICYVQAAPLYYSPFGHHMFGYFDDYPWIHLRLNRDQIIKYCMEKSIDRRIEDKTGVQTREYVYGMLSQTHVNGKTLSQYGIQNLMKSADVELLNFTRSYEGKNLLSPSVINDMPHMSIDNLITHGFELVFRIR